MPTAPVFRLSGGDLCKLQAHMLYRGAMPGIRHLQSLVVSLNDRWVRILAFALFQRSKDTEMLTIGAHSQVQRPRVVSLKIITSRPSFKCTTSRPELLFGKSR